MRAAANSPSKIKTTIERTETAIEKKPTSV